MIFLTIQKSKKEGDLKHKQKRLAVAYWDRVLIKDIVNTALMDAISKHEKKNGDIKPIPEK
jgi:hypothetical protein